MDGTYKIHNIGVLKRHVCEANNIKEKYTEELSYFTQEYCALDKQYHRINNRALENQLNIINNKKKISELQQNLKKISRSATELEQQITETEDNISILQNGYMNNSTTISIKNLQLNHYKNELVDKNHLLNNLSLLKSVLYIISGKLFFLRQEIANLKQMINEAETELETLLKTQDIYKYKIQNLHTKQLDDWHQLSKLHTQYKKLSNKISHCEIEIESLMNKSQKISEELNVHKLSLSQHTEKKLSLISKITRLEQYINANFIFLNSLKKYFIANNLTLEYLPLAEKIKAHINYLHSCNELYSKNSLLDSYFSTPAAKAEILSYKKLLKKTNKNIRALENGNHILESLTQNIYHLNLNELMSQEQLIDIFQKHEPELTTIKHKIEILDSILQQFEEKISLNKVFDFIVKQGHYGTCYLDVFLLCIVSDELREKKYFPIEHFIEYTDDGSALIKLPGKVNTSVFTVSSLTELASQGYFIKKSKEGISFFINPDKLSEIRLNDSITTVRFKQESKLLEQATIDWVKSISAILGRLLIEKNLTTLQYNHFHQKLIAIGNKSRKPSLEIHSATEHGYRSGAEIYMLDMFGYKSYTYNRSESLKPYYKSLHKQADQFSIKGNIGIKKLFTMLQSMITTANFSVSLDVPESESHAFKFIKYNEKTELVSLFNPHGYEEDFSLLTLESYLIRVRIYTKNSVIKKRFQQNLINLLIKFNPEQDVIKPDPTLTFISINNEKILCYKGDPYKTFSGYYRYMNEVQEIQEIVLQDGKPKSYGKFLMSPLDDNGNFIKQENKPIWLK